MTTQERLFVATMDVVQKYGKVQFNLGQLASLVDVDPVHTELWHESQAQSENAMLAIERTLKVLCSGKLDDPPTKTIVPLDAEEPPDWVYPEGHPDSPWQD